MKQDTDRDQLLQLLGNADEYVPPRVISHSARRLSDMTIEVNACNSQFGAGGLKDSESEEEKDQTVTY